MVVRSKVQGLPCVESLILRDFDCAAVRNRNLTDGVNDSNMGFGHVLCPRRAVPSVCYTFTASHASKTTSVTGCWPLRLFSRNTKDNDTNTPAALDFLSSTAIHAIKVASMTLFIPDERADARVER